MTSNTSGFTPSRRTLVKGAAWSVPVVAMAQPALAQDVVCSPNNTDPECNPVTPPTSRPGAACKLPGNSCSRNGWRDAYRFTYCMTNNSDADVTVNFTRIDFADGRSAPAIPSSVVVPADGQEHCYYVLVNDMGNSANGQGNLVWWYTWVDEFGNTRRVDGVSATGVNDLPPCGDCNPVNPNPTSSSLDAEEPAAEDLTVEEPETVETQSVEQPAETEAPAEVTETDAPGDDTSQTAQPQG